MDCEGLWLLWLMVHLEPSCLHHGLLDLCDEGDGWRPEPLPRWGAMGVSHRFWYLPISAVLLLLCVYIQGPLFSETPSNCR